MRRKEKEKGTKHKRGNKRKYFGLVSGMKKNNDNKKIMKRIKYEGEHGWELVGEGAPFRDDRLVVNFS